MTLAFEQIGLFGPDVDGFNAGYAAEQVEPKPVPFTFEAWMTNYLTEHPRLFNGEFARRADLRAAFEAGREAERGMRQ